jgi:hypothetical protein
MRMRAGDPGGTGRAWICRTFAATAALVASVVVVPARGADEKPDAKAACIAASERGQSQRDDGKYRAARDSFVECARDTCPRLVQQSCTKWLRELDESTPTIVLGARDEKGTDLTQVTVTLDDAPFATVLDGKPIAVDSGPHVLRFQREGAAAVELKLLVRAGEKARVVSVDLPSIPIEEPTPEQSKTPTPPSEPLLSAHHATAAAVGLGALVAAATGLALVLRSNSDSSTANGLRDQLSSPYACTANPSSAACASLNGAVSAQHTDANVATGLFVGAGVLAAGAVTLWFVWPKQKAEEAPAAAAASIVPTPGGATFVLAGSF